MNLTIRVVDEVRSSRLSDVLSSIVLRLEESMKSVFLRLAYENGGRLAARLVQLASSWGNRAILSWVNDRAYVLYLGVSSMNALKMFGCMT